MQIMNYNMKMLLPRPSNNPKGFTLIELLVVIAILAILAVIGFASFQGVSNRGNDSKRQGDLKAIADALEVAKGNNATYQTVPGTNFTGGLVPDEPTTRAQSYCYSENTVFIANPAPWTGATVCPATWVDIGGSGTITVAATTTFWKVCTMNQALATVICQGSRQ